jgi:hypothetical protein
VTMKCRRTDDRTNRSGNLDMVDRWTGVILTLTRLVDRRDR